MGSSRPDLASQNSCPICDSRKITESWTFEEFEYGDGKHAVKLTAYVPLCRCSDCDFAYTDHRAEKARDAAVCRHLKILSPDDIVAIREKYGLSQQEFANISRIGRASLARWESGALQQNGSIDNLIFLLGFEDNLNRLSIRQEEFELPTVVSEDSGRIKFRALSFEKSAALKAEASCFQLF